MIRYKIIHPNEYSEQQLEEIFAQLPEWRKAEAMRYKFRQGQVECALSYWLLSQMAGFKPYFVKGEHGKPQSSIFFNLSFADPLETSQQSEPPRRGNIGSTVKSRSQASVQSSIFNLQSSIFFNLSHCKEAVACVISDEGEVGIDVESLGRYKPTLAEYCMNDDELRQIAESDDMDATFTLLWTKKEALLKLTGEGITDDLKNCLLSERAKGVTIESGINKERGYAWSVAQYSAQFTVHSSQCIVHSS